MREDVRVSVDARVNMFTQYFVVSPAMDGEVQAFIQDTIALGESAVDTVDFESRFVSSGLSDRFNGILPRLTPKAAAPSPELEEARRQAMEETNPRKESVKYAARSILDSVAMEFKSDLRHVAQKKMIENETMDDFTKLMNLGETIEDLSDFGKMK